MNTLTCTILGLKLYLILENQISTYVKILL